VPSNYLQGGDAATYGVGTAAASVLAQASLVIDGYLQKPEGLIWAPDGNGDPAYMPASLPVASLTVSGAISPGTNLPVTVTGPILGLIAGTALLFDRATPLATEVVIVSAINGNVLTLASVKFSHAAGALLEAGLFIEENKHMPKARPLTILSRTPVMRVLAGRGRYGYTRRGSQSDYALNDFNLLASLQRFGGPPIWEVMDVTRADVERDTGYLWVPAGIMLAYYTDVHISYIAGHPQAALPADIKQACANIVAAIGQQPIGTQNVKTMRAGDTDLTRFKASYIDSDTEALLAPFRARVFA